MIKEKAFELGGALRSGKYLQGKRRLVNDNDEFCCLGVACNISTNPKLKWEKHDGKWMIGGMDTGLPFAIVKEFGFYNSLGYRRDDDSIMINGRRYENLAHANDNGASHAEIADYIEANYRYL